MNPEEYKNLNFGQAIGLLKIGKKMTRRGWNGYGMYVALQTPDENSANTLPYIYMVTAQAERVPWVTSHTDMLGTDWEVVD